MTRDNYSIFRTRGLAFPASYTIHTAWILKYIDMELAGRGTGPAADTSGIIYRQMEKRDFIEKPVYYSQRADIPAERAIYHCRYHYCGCKQNQLPAVQEAGGGAY